MASLARAEVFDPSEVAVLHLCARVVRRCFLFGVDPVTGKNHDHRKVWIEDQLKLLASNLGIDLLAMAILSNHFHYWKLQIQDFGRLFANVAGKPKDVYEMRSLISKRRFYLKRLKPTEP